MTVAAFADGYTASVTMAPGFEAKTVDMIALAIAVAVLAVASVLARWRFTQLNAPPPSRINRILWTSLTGAGGLTLILIPSKLRWGGFSAESLGLALIFDFMLRSIVALALFGAADLLLDFFRPRRNLAWLCVGPLLLAALAFMIVATSTWADTIDTGRAGQIPLTAALAAGLVWWSFLPVTNLGGKGRRMTSIFE